MGALGLTWAGREVIDDAVEQGDEADEAWSTLELRSLSPGCSAGLWVSRRVEHAGVGTLK